VISHSAKFGRLWDADTGKEKWSVKADPDRVFVVAFSNDGATITSGGADGTLRRFETATGKELPSLPAHQGRIRSLAFTPDGKTMASGGNDTMVYLWETATGKKLFTCPGHQKRVQSLVFADNGETLASTGADDGTVRLWSAGPDHKWFRNLAIARIVVEHLEGLEMKFPARSVDLEHIRREYHAAKEG